MSILADMFKKRTEPKEDENARVVYLADNPKRVLTYPIIKPIDFTHLYPHEMVLKKYIVNFIFNCMNANWVRIVKIRKMEELFLYEYENNRRQLRIDFPIHISELFHGFGEFKPYLCFHNSPGFIIDSVAINYEIKLTDIFSICDIEMDFLKECNFKALYDKMEDKKEKSTDQFIDTRSELKIIYDIKDKKAKSIITSLKEIDYNKCKYFKNYLEYKINKDYTLTIIGSYYAVLIKNKKSSERNPLPVLINGHYHHDLKGNITYVHDDTEWSGHNSYKY